MRSNSFLCLLFGLTASLPVAAQFCASPEKPQLGQVVSFTYTPPSTSSLKDSIIEGRYIRYGSPAVMHISRSTAIKLVRQGNDYVGQLPPAQKDVTGTVLLVKNAQSPQKVDLYPVLMYDATGQVVPNAIGGQASIFTRTHFLYDVGSRPDPNQVVGLYERELRQHPDLRPLYWSDYLAAVIKQRKPGYGPKVKASIEAYLASRTPPTAAEIAAGAQLYESMGDFPKARALRERQKTADPAGSLAQKDRSMSIRNETDWNRKKTAYQAFLKEFPNSIHLPALTVMMTDGYFKNNDLKGLLAFLDQPQAIQTDPLMLNSMANLLAEERRSLPEAQQLAQRGINVLKAQPKPQDFKGNWEIEKQSRHRLLMATYARTLAQQGKNDEAYVAYQEAMNPDFVEDSDPMTNERYFLCALRTNHAADTRPYIEEAIQVERATTALKNALRNWYAKQPGQNEAKADAYLADLEADIRADQRDELSKRLINEPAPAFSMTDLKGRTISSSALRGKVVVLDFWATWCGPCVASFPAMQQAQSKFQNDPNVRFLFVNTREGGPLQRVHTFMEKNPYPFVVPLDDQQRVSRAYKVQGIPTKVVIDTNGRVRYRHVGYSGDPESTVNELALVVEMLKEGK
ncbi:redoxin family protein [Spirosoma validum]|uniref:Redoxin domain-containing protein n=1 Tax=Spirosoma validum TaxID=2771355 RepID=A0A927B7E2_9BACT|nr:redoxin family protein [Spirosoma validum]MBD2756825.1 redoxin domain-containing protein [Spirosoma validum]